MVAVALDDRGRFGVLTNDVDFDIYRVRFTLYDRAGAVLGTPTIARGEIIGHADSLVFQRERGEFVAAVNDLFSTAGVWRICTTP